jgi:hypothetical protein
MRRNTLIVTERARRDLGQAKTWLTQPGSGLRGRSRYAVLLEAMNGLKAAPNRWPLMTTQTSASECAKATAFSMNGARKLAWSRS